MNASISVGSGNGQFDESQQATTQAEANAQGHSQAEQARFLGREYLASEQVQPQPKTRKGMFLGRECVIEQAPAQPKKRQVVRFLGREIIR